MLGAYDSRSDTPWYTGSPAIDFALEVQIQDDMSIVNKQVNPIAQRE
jgi:hypothetical protein